MVELTVSLGSRSYPIIVGDGALDALPRALEPVAARGPVAIVTDSNVGPLYAERVAGLAASAGAGVTVCTLPAGEPHKRLDQIESLVGQFLEAGLTRSSAVVALGGGVVGDVAGFAAAVFMRGIPYVQVPTTIVAQVDSSVGGKTGVNHATAKNIIGAFHQPAAVVADLSLLRTLPERELRAGMAEVIKHGVIADEALFGYLEDHSDAILAADLAALEYPVVRSCEIKGAVVAADETEQGLRGNLNYGHTFGHGIEAVSGYTRFLHGEAVAIGMHAAGALARELGLVDEAFVARQRACIEAYGLPVAWPGAPIDAIVAAMRRDKKVRDGRMKFIVADCIGHVVQRTDVSEAQARQALAAIASA